MDTSSNVHTIGSIHTRVYFLTPYLNPSKGIASMNFKDLV